MGLLRTIPALPVADLRLALAGWTSRLGFRAAHVGAGFAVLRRDDAEVHLWEADDVRWAERADLAERPVRSGAESFLAGTASCRIEVAGADDLAALAAELGAAEVLHPSHPEVRVTDHGTEELHALDPDGNLVTFFRWR